MVEIRSKWKDFGIFLLSQFKVCLAEPTAVLYYFGIVFLFGGAGIWMSALIALYGSQPADWSLVVSNICTYFVAILASSTADLSLRQVRSMTMLAFLLLAGAIVLAIVSLLEGSTLKGWIFSILGIILATIMWGLVNADNVHLKEELLSPEVVTGGQANQDLKGDLSGIKH